MKFNFFKKQILQSEKCRGFTLIELLVVIAIIGILASVILASLNSARDKGTAAAIKSNLKNAITQAELQYNDDGNYSNACTAITNMLTAINKAGATSSCLSYNNPGSSDVYLRFGASGIKGTSTPIQAWSASNIGVSTWDAQGVDSSGAFVASDTTMNWDTANTACAKAGGRLPTMEELKTLSDASYVASGNHTPPGFTPSNYWSSTRVPSDSTSAYIAAVYNGTIYSHITNTVPYLVRCVR